MNILNNFIGEFMFFLIKIKFVLNISRKWCTPIIDDNVDILDRNIIKYKWILLMNL